MIERYRYGDYGAVTVLNTDGSVRGDGAVGLVDLISVLSRFGTDEVSSDLNLDGIVNLADALMVIKGWTGSASPNPAAAVP